MTHMIAAVLALTGLFFAQGGGVNDISLIAAVIICAGIVFAAALHYILREKHKEDMEKEEERLAIERKLKKEEGPGFY